MYGCNVVGCSIVLWVCLEVMLKESAWLLFAAMCGEWLDSFEL